MKDRDLRLYRMGFSLVEMLVVIGILAILIAALLPFLGGSRDSAQTAKCQNNMRNLAQAVISYANANGEHGEFPPAGYYRSIDPGERRVMYWARRSWISNKGDLRTLNSSQPSPIVGDVAHFTDSEDDCRFAVTNGAIWQAAGASFDVYRCPIHARTYQDTYQRPPGWSYMMNQEFGYNEDGRNKLAFYGSSVKGLIRVATGTSGKRKDGEARRGHDKVLLFAEVQGVDLTGKGGVSLKAVSSGNETDAVLEYTKETMGFNHKVAKFKFGGNVAFADGHVETIIYPTGVNPRELTRHLCQGYDVPHDGRAYTISEDDKK